MLATPTPTILSPNFYISNKLTKLQKQKKKQHKLNQLNHKNNKSNNLSYVNPILITQTTKPTSQLQALDAVINDLEHASLKNGIDVDPQTFCSLLETCFKLNAFDHGIRVHGLIPPRILSRNVGVVSKLVRLYAANGRIDDAHQLFDEMPKREESAFVWNSLISGYADLGMYEDALAIYFQMDEEGVMPDNHTFPRVLAACGGIGLITVGEEIHRHVVRYGVFNDGFVLNALVDMYAKCGDIVKARKVFDKISSKDLVSWNSMIIAYIHHGLITKAANIFREMLSAGFLPDEVTISTIICNISSLKIGCQLHGWALRRGLESSLPITNSLIAFYSSHGFLDQARWLFTYTPGKDIISWNSILSAHRNGPLVLTYFEKMESNGVTPDAITFVTLLSACAKLGLVNKGESFFSIMRHKYGISPTMEHYACMVNLYGRAGLISKAYDIISSKTEFEAGPTLWGALLYACFRHVNAEIGEVAAQKLFELEPDNEHNFELLIRIYESLGRLDDVEKVRRMMKDRGLDS
ncbi:hypothetical protein RND81_12G122700 [Saponaria officinalis]|uniref:Pentatricopeptide repeat-containing protein n=1 Tax=Saponaria officinalis TaxID=3572 RepID=A0AAW1H9T1_SAPOF